MSKKLNFAIIGVGSSIAIKNLFSVAVAKIIINIFIYPGLNINKIIQVFSSNE